MSGSRPPHFRQRVMSMAKTRARSFAHAMRRGRGGAERGSGRVVGVKSSASCGGGGGPASESCSRASTLRHAPAPWVLACSSMGECATPWAGERSRLGEAVVSGRRGCQPTRGVRLRGSVDRRASARGCRRAWPDRQSTRRTRRRSFVVGWSTGEGCRRAFVVGWSTSEGCRRAFVVGWSTSEGCASSRDRGGPSDPCASGCARPPSPRPVPERKPKPSRVVGPAARQGRHARATCSWA